MNKTARIYGINGSVIYLKGNTGFSMSEMVYVGRERLAGEVIRLTSGLTTIQVFEDTTGLSPGDPVEASGSSLCVTLGPGILNNIFDGVGRPLRAIAASSGSCISRGFPFHSQNTGKKWEVHITVKPGEEVRGGSIFAETPETPAIVHRSMLPPHLSGRILDVVPDGTYTILDPLVTLQLDDGSESTLPSVPFKFSVRPARS